MYIEKLFFTNEDFEKNIEDLRKRLKENKILNPDEKKIVDDELNSLQKEALKLEIKHGKNKYKHAIIGFLAGSIVSVGCVLIEINKSDTIILKEIPIKVSFASHLPEKDTIYIYSDKKIKK